MILPSSSQFLPSILLLNIRSLRPKIDELSAFSSATSPDILAVCETWLDSTVSDSQISLPYYGAPYRSDRNDERRGGGVCLYVKNSIKNVKTLKMEPCPKEIECLWLLLASCGVIFVLLYIPPNLHSDSYVTIANYLIENVDNAFEADPSTEKKLVVAGDTNQFPSKLLCEALGLRQVVDAPTRKKAILDKIFLDVSITDCYHAPTIGPNFGNTDHWTVLLQPVQRLSPVKEIRKVFDFRHDKIGRVFLMINSHPWHHMYKSEATLQEKCSYFYEVINCYMDQLPYSFVEMSASDKPWVTPKLKLLFNKRYEAFRSGNYPVYQHYKSKIKEEINHAKLMWATKMRQSKGNFWSLVRPLTGYKSKANGVLQKIMNDYTSLQNAAEDLNSNFTDIFAPSPDWNSIEDSITDNDGEWNINITESQTEAFLKALKINKSPGSDKISPRMLRECAAAISGPLTHLYSLSVRDNEMPKEWTLGDVVPVPKPKAKTKADLRPITLLPIISKILERFVLMSIKYALLDMYGNNQFGFRPRSSTLHAHIDLHDFMTRQLDLPDVRAVMLISFDMKKAFDKLDHQALFRSLCDAKLPGKCLKWLVSYLKGRTQRVVLEHTFHSAVSEVTSGVPQGSILGPYLFAAHVGSFSAVMDKSKLLKFADDFLIVCPLYDKDTCERIVDVETRNMSDWCKSHGLCLNSQKTTVMAVGNNSRFRTVEQPWFSKCLKFLGMTFEQSLKWDNHIHNICRQASSRLFVLRRMKLFLDKRELITLYYACIRSVLEYNSEVFIGLNEMNNSKLERVNRRAHRIVCGKKCDCPHFPPLKARREARANKTFKTLFNEHNLIKHTLPIILPRSQHLQLPHMNTQRRALSFIPQTIVNYNKLL